MSITARSSFFCRWRGGVTLVCSLFFVLVRAAVAIRGTTGWPTSRCKVASRFCPILPLKRNGTAGKPGHLGTLAHPPIAVGRCVAALLQRSNGI